MTMSPTNNIHLRCYKFTSTRVFIIICWRIRTTIEVVMVFVVFTSKLNVDCVHSICKPFAPDNYFLKSNSLHCSYFVLDYTILIDYALIIVMNSHFSISSKSPLSIYLLFLSWISLAFCSLISLPFTKYLFFVFIALIWCAGRKPCWLNSCWKGLFYY